MSVEQSIRDKLEKALAPVRLTVENESSKHAGHAGVADVKPGVTGETHFRVVVIADRFEGQSRVDRHRLINDLLKDELNGPVHALAIKAQTPTEAAK